jgi:hypothetical protein
MKAIVMLLFILICLPILGIRAIISIFKKGKKIDDTKKRIDKAINRELTNHIKRKMCVLIVFMCLFFQIQAQVKSYGSIEVGWKDALFSVLKKDLYSSQIHFKNVMYADIKLGFEWRFIKIEQILNNNIQPVKFTLYRPIDIEYRLRFSLNHKKMSIGYEHACMHPVVSYFSDLESFYRRGGEDKIFLKFEW